MKTIIFIIGIDVLRFPLACIHRLRDFHNTCKIPNRNIITSVQSETKTL
ncbi:hypothetical protein [Chryseobacterium sp. SNU WT5]|nr:hypothetical protein [Chryseobacterium sp. SNU WT5]